MRNDFERVRDILRAIDKIEERTPSTRGEFDEDELLQVWAIHHIEILGKAARGLGDGFRQRHPQVPWRHLISMRNVLVHEYFGIDLDEVWLAITRDLPKLKEQIRKIQCGERSG